LVHLQGHACCFGDLEISREVVNLTPRSRKRALNGNLSIFLSRVIRGRLIDDDVLVRRNCQPNEDLKSSAMAMLVAWSNNGYAASRNALIVCFQPLDLFQYQLVRRWRWLGTFEGNFWGDLHLGPSGDTICFPCQSASGRMVASGNVLSQPQSEHKS
jgi:hypothetical protein